MLVPTGRNTCTAVPVEGPMSSLDNLNEGRHHMRRNRMLALTVGASLGLAIAATPAAANHTYGVLDCGPAGTYEIQAASIAPLTFEAPVPSSGLFLLEDTNRVFRAFSLETPRSLIVLQAINYNPHATVECTLTSSGFNFEEPWILHGMLTAP
jgi:hypothetical protein